MNYSTMTDGELSEQWDWQRKIIESPWSVTRKSLAERRLKLIEAELERRKINEKRWRIMSDLTDKTDAELVRDWNANPKYVV